MTSDSSSVDWDVFKARAINYTKNFFTNAERRIKLIKFPSSLVNSASAHSSHQLGWTSPSEERRLGEDWVLGIGQSESKRHVDAKKQHFAEWWVLTKANWTLIGSPNWIFHFSCIGEEKLHSPILSIEAMDRHKGGVYICTANNNVGKPASSQVVLHVLCE